MKSPGSKEDLEDQEDRDRDTECGYGPCRRITFLNYLANKNSYIIIYGALGCVLASTYAYSNATISTIEKRFKIPTKISGVISVGNDVSSLLATMVLSYYAGKGHRPRWIAAGIYSVAAYCFITLLPHLLWGAGQDALSLTIERGADLGTNASVEALLLQKRKTLCRAGLNTSFGGSECDITSDGGSDTGLAPAALLFLGQFVSGLGGALYFTLGLSYLDDNAKKSKSPFLISVSYFLRMLGPALGYALGSFFLKFYISPSLTPTITNSDPRWLGAWWAGWMVLGVSLLVLGTVIGMFPHTLPSAKRRMQREASANTAIVTAPTENTENPEASLKDMKEMIVRLFTNKMFVYNIVSALLYSFGFMPYWVYTPKYIEIQYHTTASQANFFTGSVGLVCSAAGVLLSGVAISYFKPSARYLAGWNVVVSTVSLIAILLLPFMGCLQSDIQNEQMKINMAQACNADCRCDFVKYSPVCSEDGRTTFISACHAGCTDHVTENGRKIYTNCQCISRLPLTLPSTLSLDYNTSVTLTNGSGVALPSVQLQENPSSPRTVTGGSPLSLDSQNSQYGRAFSGPCGVDCASTLITFVALMCLVKFFTASSRASNMLLTVRCVEPRDKAPSLGVDVMLFNLFVFIPSPIIFGFIMDSTCLIWGQTCSGKGNCWQYDGENMRNVLNFTAAVFVALGTMFDMGVWYHVKHLQIFDEDEEKNEKDKNAKKEPSRELEEVQDKSKQRHQADNPAFTAD